MASSSADSRLIPAGVVPLDATVCSYSSVLGTGPRRGALVRSVHLDSAQADQLARATGAVDIVQLRGTVSCPNDVGTITVITFEDRGGAGSAVWWATSGCQRLDNGRTVTWQLGNPSFARFQHTYLDVVRAAAQ